MILKTQINSSDSTKTLFNSLILIVIFILPYVFIASIDAANKNIYDFILVVLWMLIGIYLKKRLFNKNYANALSFSILFSLFSIFNQIVNNYFSLFNIIAPFAAFFGYVFVIEFNLSRKSFNLLMIGNYIFFFIIYFSKNTANLFVEDSQLQTEMFVNTSSNVIPAVLIITLYICDVLNFIKFNKRNDKFILGFACINLILILIQRSRAGIIVSLIFLVIKLYDYNRKLLLIFLFALTVFASVFSNEVALYIEFSGGVSGDGGYFKDVRGQALESFFFNMTSLKAVLFGYGKDISLIIFYGTQALFLNIWNYQGLIFLLILSGIILKRFVNNSKKMVPLIYFLPFLVYSIFEGFFLPNYWDFVIYLILFYKKGEVNKNLNN